MSLSPEEKQRIREGEKVREEAKKEIQNKDIKKGCLGCLGVAVVIAIIAGIVSAFVGGSSDSPDKIDAWVMAQQFIERELKAPSSAEFGSVWGGDYQDPDKVVTDLGNGKFIVSGWVDAENSFGAKIRTYFVCELEYIGDEKWRLIEFGFVE